MKAATLRVLHVLPGFDGGGAARVAHDLAVAADNGRFEVGVASLFGATGSAVERRLEDAGIHLWRLDKRVGVDVRMFPRLASVFGQFDPDVVHTHLNVLRYVFPLVLTGRRRAIVHTLHNEAQNEVSAIDRRIHATAFRWGAKPVSIARAVTKSIEDVYRIYDAPLIPNGIQIDQFRGASNDAAAIRASMGIRPDDVVFVNVGRLFPQKNHALLVAAFAEAFSHADNVHLVVAGEGALGEALRSQAAAVPAGRRVHFVGSRSDVPALLRAADAFVLSSSWEGNPLCVMEALAAGLPVISTAVGGVTELIANARTGLLVPPEDAGALAHAMRTLAADRHRREEIGRRAAADAVRFDVRRTARAYESLYLAMTDERSRARVGAASLAS